MGASLESGGVFAGYRIVRRLGAGGMGTVYLAEHPNLPRLVALKLLNRALTDDEDVRARFLREADTAARLDHRNIVAVYDRGNEGGQLWIAMQYVDGSDVAQLLRDGPLPVGRAVWIVTETAAALDYAHGHGVLHRDVKPANILLTDASRGEPERVLLADFGIAKALDETGGFTRSGMLLASLQYAAPEQFDIGVAVDHRVDVYALGATLYRMLTGALPYPGSTPAQLMYGHLSLPIPKPSRHGEVRVPEGFDVIVERALAKDRECRYSSCGELAAAANDALAASSKELTATVSSSPVPPKSEMVPEGIPAVGGAEYASTMKPAVVAGTPVRKRRVRRGLVAVLVVAAGVGVLHFFWPRPPIGIGPPRVVTSIEVGNGAFGVAVDPSAHAAYVANNGANSLSMIDTTSRTVTDTIAVGHRPVGVAVDPATHGVFVTNYDDSSVSVIDTVRRTIATVAVGGHPGGVIVDPDTHIAYVTNGDNGSVSLIDTTTNAVRATVPTGNGSNRVALDPIAHRVYVTNDGDRTVSVIDSTNRTVIGTVAVPGRPGGVAIDPAHFAYVTNSDNATVSVIDTVGLRVTATITVGQGPGGIAVDPATHTAYVANYREGTVSVIDTSSLAVRPVSLFGNPLGVAIDPTTHTAYVTSDIEHGSVSLIER
ncbi:serine/threonine-protein kinase [Nocardia sp. NPDC101769]|uniref:serine/threonine-protein kinase n=1 Tax=Nocardia sp. NPDC101769 TaxID=3364333 RepID=UPI00381E92A5